MTDVNPAIKLDAEAISQRLKSVNDYVRDCQRRVSLGEIMDLQGLDNNVIEICDAIAGLPQKDAQVLESRMSELIEGLEYLARAMKEQQDKMEGKGA